MIKLKFATDERNEGSFMFKYNGIWDFIAILSIDAQYFYAVYIIYYTHDHRLYSECVIY